MGQRSTTAELTVVKGTKVQGPIDDQGRVVVGFAVCSACGFRARVYGDESAEELKARPYRCPNSRRAVDPCQGQLEFKPGAQP